MSFKSRLQTSLGIHLSLKTYIGREFGIFLGLGGYIKSLSLYEWRTRNFSKSQSQKICEYRGIPECDVIRGKGVYSAILRLPLGSRDGNFSKSFGHFPDCDVIRGWLPPVGGVRHETCQNVLRSIFYNAFLSFLHKEHTRNTLSTRRTLNLDESKQGKKIRVPYLGAMTNHMSTILRINIA